MRKLAVILALVIGFWLPRTIHAAIAVVTSVITGGTQHSVTTTGVDTSGANLIVLLVSSYHAGGAVTVSDSKSNTWTALTQRNSTTDIRARLYYCASPTVGASHTFTASGSGIYPSLGAIAFSGAAASPFDLESGGAAESGTTSQPGSITPGENNCVLVSGVGNGGTGMSINSGFTASSVDFSFGAHNGGGIAYKIQTTAGAENPTWSWTTSSANATAMASFKAEAAAGGGNSYYYQRAIGYWRPVRNILRVTHERDWIRFLRKQ